MHVSNRNCWICEQPAIDDRGAPFEKLEVNTALQRVAHQRCTPLAELATRSVYRAVDGTRLGPNRRLALHVRTSGSRGGRRGLLLCKNTSEMMRRLGDVRRFGGAFGFSGRADACGICAREYALQVERMLGRIRGRRGIWPAIEVVASPPT